MALLHDAPSGGRAQRLDAGPRHAGEPVEGLRRRTVPGLRCWITARTRPCRRAPHASAWEPPPEWPMTAMRSRPRAFARVETSSPAWHLRPGSCRSQAVLRRPDGCARAPRVVRHRFRRTAELRARRCSRLAALLLPSRGVGHLLTPTSGPSSPCVPGREPRGVRRRVARLASSCVWQTASSLKP